MDGFVRCLWRLYVKTYYVASNYCTDFHLNEAGDLNKGIG